MARLNPLHKIDGKFNYHKLANLDISLIIQHYPVEEIAFLLNNTEPSYELFDVIDRHIEYLVSIEYYEMCCPLRDYKTKHSVLI